MTLTTATSAAENAQAGRVLIHRARRRLAPQPSIHHLTRRRRP